jgi:hypothetical protein
MWHPMLIMALFVLVIGLLKDILNLLVDVLDPLNEPVDFLGRSCGQIFFIFADFFFRRRKKRAVTFQTFSVYFYVQNL